MNRIKISLLYIVITLIFFGTLIKLSYATDTYQVFNWRGDEVFAQFANSGRFITAIVGKFVKIINIPEQSIYIGSYILAIICTFISLHKLYNIIETKNKILKILIPTLIIINPFSIELFLFIENGIMMFGVLMCIYALENLIKFWKSSKRKYIIYSLAFMFLANCSYQGVVGIFISIALIYILKFSKNIKEFIKNNFIVGVIYGVPAFLNLILVKTFFTSSRINGQIILIESLKKIYEGSKNMIINTYSLFPKYVFVLAILFTFICFCSKIWKESEKILAISKIIYIIVGVTLFAIAPQFMQQTQSIWFVPRATYCFGALYGILLLYLTLNFEVGQTIKIAIIIVSISFILLQLSKFITIEKDRYILNQKDHDTTSQIINKISEYEATTGNRITKLAVYNDKVPHFTYDGIFATGDINVKCYANDWSAVAILNYYLKRNITLVEKDNNLSEKFLQKNWNQFDLEQIIIKEDTINLCNY